MSTEGEEGMFGQVMILILGIVGLVIVLYILIAQGIGGPATTQISTLTCTIAANSRGLFMKGAEPLANEIVGITMASAFMFGGVPVVEVGGVPVVSVGGVTGAKFIQNDANIFALSLLSSVPLICPASTVDVGYDAQGKQSTPANFYNVLGGKLIDIYTMFGSGKYNPLVGADPPNPRVVFVLETHLTEEVSFANAISQISALYPNTSSWFGIGGDNKEEDRNIFLYCPDSTVNFGACTFKDARIYVMYKDDHTFDRFSAGNGLCSINKDAIEYSEKASSILQIGSYGNDDREKDKISDASPWRWQRDVVVVCIEKM